MSLLVFFIVHHLIPGGTKFAKQDHSLRFAEDVSESDAKEYIFKHHGRRETEISFGAEKIISPQFAEIITIQKTSQIPFEISASKVSEALKSK